MLPEIRMARIVEAIGRVRDKRLSCVEAAALLGISERHFRRLRDSFEEGGAEAIVDRRRGRRASNKAPTDMAKARSGLHDDDDHGDHDDAREPHSRGRV